MKFFSKDILLILAISSSLQAVPMLTDGKERTVPKKENSEEVTASARHAEQGREEVPTRGGVSLAQDAALLPVPSETEPSILYGSRIIYLSQLIMPQDFSFYMRKQFQEDLEEIKKIVGSRNPATSMKRGHGLILYWQKKGVEMDSAYMESALSCRQQAEALTARASQIKDHVGKAFAASLKTKRDYYSVIHAFEKLVKITSQTALAWEEAATIYERMPGLYRSLETKEKWAREAQQAKKNGRKALIEMLVNAEETSNKMTKMADEGRRVFEVLQLQQNDRGVSMLTDACKKMMLAQRAVIITQRNFQKMVADIHFHSNRNVVLSLEMALEAANRTTVEVERIYDEVMSFKKAVNKSKTSREDFVSREENLLKDFSSFEQIKKTNDSFEQQTKALNEYTRKSLDAIREHFFLVVGNGEFEAVPDLIDLVNAENVVEAMSVVLNVLKPKRATAGPWQQEKQDLAISNLEQAMEQVQKIVSRGGNEDGDENDQKMDAVLTYLQQCKEEYTITVAAIQKM